MKAEAIAEQMAVSPCRATPEVTRQLREPEPVRFMAGSHVNRGKPVSHPAIDCHVAVVPIIRRRG